RMDHRHLNELPFFQDKNPSSENIARFVYNALLPPAKTQNVKVLRVKVWESENAAVTYSEEKG
ncbi:MAG: 6-carboxytetrahydropterin synthase, partial [Smithellaceae bacterium]